eukprot:4357224-Amphidinium_carterae.1
MQPSAPLARSLSSGNTSMPLLHRGSHLKCSCLGLRLAMWQNLHSLFVAPGLLEETPRAQTTSPVANVDRCLPKC